MNYERGIPPELPENEKKQIFEALIHHRHCQLTDVAMQACDRWEISGELLRGFIQQHFDWKHKIYKKSDGYNQGRYLPWTAQANVRIRDGLEVYVSLSLRSGGILFIDAHVHTTSRRLPR